MQTEPSMLDTLLSQIEQAFFPKAVICQISGKTHIIEKITEGWCWRNEDGDCQEDFQILPFATSAEAQQSAIDHVRKQNLMALYLRRTSIWKRQPTCNLAASQAEKQAYREQEAKWLKDMSEIDGLIAAARKGLV